MIGAGYVRGYSGFGFAAILIAGAGLVTDPRNLLAVVVLSDLTTDPARLRTSFDRDSVRNVTGVCNCSCGNGLPHTICVI